MLTNLLMLFVLLAGRDQPANEAEAIYMLCELSGGECVYEEETRCTSYVPLYGGINCDGDCSITAYSEPVDYTRTIACSEEMPYGTDVFIEGFGFRGACLDTGGAITTGRIDVAMLPEDRGSFIHATLPVVWVIDTGDNNY